MVYADESYGSGKDTAPSVTHHIFEGKESKTESDPKCPFDRKCCFKNVSV